MEKENSVYWSTKKNIASWPSRNYFWGHVMIPQPGMGLSMSWLQGAAAVVAGLAVIANLPVRLWLPAERATVQYLAAADLQTITKTKEERKKFKVGSDLSMHIIKEMIAAQNKTW